MSSLERSIRRQHGGHFKIPTLPELDKPRLNRWLCACGWSLVTIERVDGVTPFIIRCDKCKGEAQSGFYRDEGLTNPTHEWRQPTRAEFGKLSRACQDHVSRGGLLDFPYTRTYMIKEAP